jgi:co-chaperonin GroES (HSP10)
MRRSACLIGVGVLVSAPGLSSGGYGLWAQAAASAPAASARQMGTVKAISGTSMTIATDAGQQVAVTVADGARIVQLAPGSTDLKTAQAIALTDIGVGDRVLVTGKAGDAAGSFGANRVILMKSGDIAQKHASEQADWQKRGVGGLVSSVDAGSGAVTISSGAKKIQVQTTAQTIFRRYAGDSVKFEDAKPGTIAQIQAGDQLEVRGAKAEDGSSVQAEEVVSGSFRNLSGTLASVNAAAGTITLKDLTTKKMMTVTVTANSDLRKLPPEVAARFAARQRGAAAGGATAAGGAPAGGGGAGSAGAGPRPVSGDRAAAGAGAGAGGMGGGRSAGMDLSKLLARLPSATIADLHTGDAVMIVASQTQGASDAVTAVTLLSGVDAILAATPTGTQAITLSPWNVGGGAPEGGGGGAP